MSRSRDWPREPISQAIARMRRRTERKFLSVPSFLVFLVVFSLGLFMGGCSGEVNSPHDTIAVVKLSPEQEFSAALKKSEAGDADSQYAVGRMLTKGDGVPKDLFKAIEWYQKAALQGNAKAMVQLGNAYANKSIGIKHDFEGIDANVYKAAEWYQKAANLGDADAQYVLGLAFDKLSNNASLRFAIKHDSARAYEWYMKAAAQGHTKAMMQLGSLSGLGEGTPKDEAKALEWHLKAAAHGDSYAQMLIGMMYERGNVSNGRKDLVLAYAWMNIASVNDQTAIMYRNQYEREL